MTNRAGTLPGACKGKVIHNLSCQIQGQGDERSFMLSLVQHDKITRCILLVPQKLRQLSLLQNDKSFRASRPPLGGDKAIELSFRAQARNLRFKSNELSPSIEMTDLQPFIVQEAHSGDGLAKSGFLSFRGAQRREISIIPEASRYARNDKKPFSDFLPIHQSLLQNDKITQCILLAPQKLR